MARRHECTKKVIDQIVKARGLTASWKHAANSAGKGLATVMGWNKRARDACTAAGLDPEDLSDNWQETVPEEEWPFVELLDRTTRAFANAMLKLLSAATLSATGGRFFDEDGNPTTVFDEYGNEISGVPRDGRVAIKMMACRDNEYSEHKRLEHTGPADGQIPRIIIETVSLPAPDPEPSGERVAGDETGSEE